MSSPTSAESGASSDKHELEKRRVYLKSTFRVILCLLPFWFLVSYGCGILFRDWLDANAPKIGNAPFGFWMAQQGSVIGFVLLLIVYAVWMNALDRKYNSAEGQK